MTNVDLPYLEIFRMRRTVAAYYRRNGIRRRLRNENGDPVNPSDRNALLAAWQREHTAHEEAIKRNADAQAKRTVRDRSIADLINLYRNSPEWEEKAPETQRDYEKALKPLFADYGHMLVEGLRRTHVGMIRDSYAWRQKPDPEQPGKTQRVSNARQANRVITVLSILLSYSIDPLGWREDNPALRPRRLKTNGDGYRPWTHAEFLKFWTASNVEWRFAALLALLTGQRGQDQVAMRWSDYDGQSIYVVQEKGRRAVKLWVPCHPVLRVLLDQRREELKQRATVPLKPEQATILTKPEGGPWKPNQLQKAAGKAIRRAGLSGVVWHGLRGAAASWAAEGGATDQDIASLLGHNQVQTTRHYSRGASRRRQAERAVAAIALPIEIVDENAAETPTAKRRGGKLPSTDPETD